jgi:hypothetical protein
MYCHVPDIEIVELYLIGLMVPSALEILNLELASGSL